MAYKVITIGCDGIPLTHATFERTMPTDYCTLLAKGDYIGVIITYEDLLFWFTGGMIRELEHARDVFMRANADAHNFLTEQGVDNPIDNLIDRLKAWKPEPIVTYPETIDTFTDILRPEVPMTPAEANEIIPDPPSEAPAEAILLDDDIPF